MAHLLNKHAGGDMEIATPEHVDMAPDRIEDAVKNNNWKSRVASDFCTFSHLVYFNLKV